MCYLRSNVSHVTDSVSFLRVPQHTKFNLLCAVPTVARVHTSEAAARRNKDEHRGGWNRRWRDGRRGRKDRKTEKEEREETLSLGITITEQVKRDKCQRTLGEIKQQLACTHPGKHKSATVRESPGLWSK